MSVWVMPFVDVYENFLKRSQAVAGGRRRSQAVGTPKGHLAIEHCPCMGAVVLCSAPRPFVAVFSVKTHQECPCIRAKCTHKRYISSRQCDIEALNMVQCVFHHGAITIHRPLIVLLVHTTPYAS